MSWREGISMLASCEEWWIVCLFPSSFRMICLRHRRTEDASSIELGPTSLPLPRSRSIARSDDYGHRVTVGRNYYKSTKRHVIVSHPISTFYTSNLWRGPKKLIKCTSKLQNYHKIWDLRCTWSTLKHAWLWIRLTCSSLLPGSLSLGVW